MRRRDFIALVGGAAVASPLAGRAQPQPVPVIGFLHCAPPGPFTDLAFILGLKTGGYVDGQNVRIEYRWGDGVYERLPILAAELVDLRVAVMVTFGTAAARVAKTTSVRVNPAIPVVFSIGSDPVAEDFVTISTGREAT